MGKLSAQRRRLGFTLPVALVLMLAILLAMHFRRTRFLTSLDPQIPSAYARGDWSLARTLALRVPESDPRYGEACRWIARAEARLGQDDAWWHDLSVRTVPRETEDFVLLGLGLARNGRPVLAAAAFEAALRLDPKRREAGDALVDLNDSIERLPGAARAVDHLAAIPDGQALGELVVALVAIEGKDAKPAPDGFDPILDRVLQHERSEMARIRHDVDVRKLLARVLLEAGRPREARQRLEREPPARRDPETEWLLSRAFLAEGDVTHASQALERSGAYGRDRPLAHEPSRYAGAARCAECHQTITQTQQSSRHAATLARGNALKTVPLPSGPLADPVVPSVVHHFERVGNTVRAEAKVGDRTIQAVVDYAIGSGHHGLTLLARDPTGGHRSLRMSYYAGGDTWDVTTGFNPHPAVPEQFLGERLGEENFRNCVNCHATRFRSEHDRDGPESIDKGIGCERCHGPGDNHLNAVALGFPEPAIARPKQARPADRAKVCASCHSADALISPSDPQYVRFQSTTLAFSRCVTESGGRFDCVSCHDPHRNVNTVAADYEARCLACHGKSPSSVEVEALRLEPVRAGRCPVEPARDCLTCHMPKVENVVKFTGFTDHHIRVHRERSSRPASAVEASPATP